MKSLSVLTVDTPGDDSGYHLTEVARHFATLWSAAVTAVGDNEWLVADMEGNLVVLRRNIGGVTLDDQKRLQVTGELRLGEVVNKIVPIFAPSTTTTLTKERSRTLSTAANPLLNEAGTKATGAAMRTGSIVTPRAFLATVEGAIYMHGTINPSFVDAMLRLQSALASKVQAPGYMPWAKFRAFRTEVSDYKEEPFRFVDGEMVEQGLLALGDEELKILLREEGLSGDDAGGLGMSVEEVRAWGEELRRLY